MLDISNSMSAFGISWPKGASTSHHQQQPDVSTMSSTQAVRSDDANDAVTLDSFEIIKGSSTQKHDLEDSVVNAAIGYEQGTSKPYVADRQEAMRVLNRKGQILDGNPYRLPGVPHGAQHDMPGSKDDFEVVYHSDALDPIREQAAGPQKLAVETLQPRKSYQETRATAYLDDETLARLEGRELFPQDDDWVHVDDTEKVPVSKFSPWDSDSSPERTGICRSFSKKVKSSFRRPARPEISAPLLDLKHQPDNPAGMPAVMSYAMPIQNPAPELAVRANTVHEARSLRRQNPNIGERKPSKKKKPQDFEAPRRALAPPRHQKPHKVTVVGEPDRMTELGDFMDTRSLESSSNGEIEEDDAYDRDRTILKVRSLHPLRKPGNKVDTSKHSWMPPEPPALPKAAKVTSQNDWGMSAEYPSVQGICNEIDQQIAEMYIGGENEHQMQQSTDEPIPVTSAAGEDEEEEREIMIDTYVNDDHTRWKATQRVGENTSQPTQRQSRQERATRPAKEEEDDAAALWARLQALRK